MIQILNRALWVLFLVLTPLTFVGILSQNSIPGDFLYSIKRGYEGTALAFASLAPETKASYTTSLATVRFTEAEKLLLAKSDTQGLATLVEQVQKAQDNVAAVQNSPQKEELEQKLIASIDAYQANLLKVQQQIASNVVNQPVQTAPAQEQPITNQVIQTAQTTSPANIQPTQIAISAPIPTPSSSETTAPTQTPTPTTTQGEVPTTTTPTMTQAPSTTPTTIQTTPPAGTTTTTPETRKKIDEEIEKTKERLDEIRKKVKSQRNQQVENSTSNRDNGRGDSERRNDDNRK